MWNCSDESFRNLYVLFLFFFYFMQEEIQHVLIFNMVIFLAKDAFSRAAVEFLFVSIREGSDMEDRYFLSWLL